MTMMERLIGYLTGHFDNSQQLERFEREGITGYPRAEHRNTVCNDRITGLPADFPEYSFWRRAIIRRTARRMQCRICSCLRRKRGGSS